MQWSILLSIVLFCLICVVLYLFLRAKKLLKQLQDKEQLEEKLQSKSEMIESLSKELANQIEYEIAERLKSDNAHDYLFENTQHAIAITQDEDLKIIKCNKECSRLFGDVLNHNVLELFSDKAQKILIYEKISALKESKSRQNLRLNLATKNFEIPVIISLHFLEYAQKRALYVTFTDISDIAKLEDDLRNKQLMLTQKTKAEEMGKMLGNIAHQWKQPLNALYLLCQNLKELQQLGDVKDFPKYLQMMSEQISFMSSTIDAFRAFYLPSKAKENFSVNKIIQNTLDLFYKLVDKRISIELLPSDELSICAIKNEFQQIMLVLIDNAIEATKAHIEKGAINEGLVQILCTKENIAGIDYCAIIVRDSGGGISADISKKIFDAFFTTKENGSGIGLPMVQMLLENIQGRISFLNIKNGAEFKITIPCEK